MKNRILSLFLILALFMPPTHLKALAKKGHLVADQVEKPPNYASFIITSSKNGKKPQILAEEQDRFEFPDKKIRVKISGPAIFFKSLGKKQPMVIVNEAKSQILKLQITNYDEDKPKEPGDVQGQILDQKGNLVLVQDEEENGQVGNQIETKVEAEHPHSDHSTLDDELHENHDHEGGLDHHKHPYSDNSHEPLQEKTEESVEGDDESLDHHKHPYSDNTHEPLQENVDEEDQRLDHDDEHPYSDHVQYEKEGSDQNIHISDEEDTEDIPLDPSEPDVKDIVDDVTDVSGEDELLIAGKENYEINVVSKDQFVQAGSVFWFDQDQAIYVADSYGGKVYRFLQDLDSKNYQQSEIKLGENMRGILGPVVPQKFEPNNSTVYLSVGFNTDIFHRVPWDLSSDTADFQQNLNLVKRTRNGVLERERYNRLGFASKDPFGRVVTSSIDTRTKLSSYPCMDFLLLDDPVLGTKHLFLDHLKGDELVCRVGGAAFRPGDPDSCLYYIDEYTRNLVKFDYDSDAGRIESYDIMAHHPVESDQSGRPKALTFDLNGYLWVGFTGSGKIMVLDLARMEVIATLQIQDKDIEDLTLDERNNSVYILTQKNLYVIKEKSN